MVRVETDEGKKTPLLLSYFLLEIFAGMEVSGSCYHRCLQWSSSQSTVEVDFLRSGLDLKNKLTYVINSAKFEILGERNILNWEYFESKTNFRVGAFITLTSSSQADISLQQIYHVFHDMSLSSLTIFR